MRSLVLIVSLAQSALFAGILFGWPAFAKILEQGGIFLDDSCQGDATPAVECILKQRSSMAFLYTAASSFFIFSSLPGGMLLDRSGPSITSVAGGLLVSGGFAGVAMGSDDLMAPSFMLIGAGCSLTYSTSLKAAFLFPQSLRTPIISAVNALFDASSLVPLCLHALSETLPIVQPQTRRRVVFLALSTLSAVLFSLWAIAWASVRSTTKRASLRIANGASSGAAGADAAGGAIHEVDKGATTQQENAIPEKRRPLMQQPFWLQCRSPQMLLISLWMCILYLRASYFLSGAARATLHSLGDTQDTYISILLAMQPLSIVVGPPCALAIDRFGHVRVMYALSLLSAISYAAALVPSLPFQVVTFTIMTTVRACMYPTSIGYLAKTFGERTLGSTTGAMFVLMGFSNLATYPLSVLANSVFAGDVRPVMLAVCVLPLPIHLFVVYRLSLLKANILPFPPRWTKVMAEVRTSELHRWGGTHSCPVCIQPIKRPIELSCTHVLCMECATRMSDHQFRKCPVCRHPHLLDPKLLKERSAAWRSAYGEWRSGKVRGAIGEVGSITRARAPGQSSIQHATHKSDLVRALDLVEAKSRPTKLWTHPETVQANKGRMRAPPAASRIPQPPPTWLQEGYGGEGTSHTLPDSSMDKCSPVQVSDQGLAAWWQSYFPKEQAEPWAMQGAGKLVFKDLEA